MSHSPVEVIMKPVFSNDELIRLRHDIAAFQSRVQNDELEYEDRCEAADRWAVDADDLLDHCDFLDRKIGALKKQRATLQHTVDALQARVQKLEREKAAADDEARRSRAAAAAATAAAENSAATQVCGGPI
jgi:septal ring factor EnvC (AmiA/AmiB activator)